MILEYIPQKRILESLINQYVYTYPVTHFRGAQNLIIPWGNMCFRKRPNAVTEPLSNLSFMDDFEVLFAKRYRNHQKH